MIDQSPPRDSPSTWVHERVESATNQQLVRTDLEPTVAVKNEAVMTIDELATYLKVAKSTLYKLAQTGRVPGQKVGKHWRFSKPAIDVWLQANPKESPRR